MYVDNGELKFKNNLIKRTKGVTSIFLSFVLLISLVLTSNSAIEVFAAGSFSVTLTAGANQSSSGGDLIQSNLGDDVSMNEVTFSATEGYHFNAYDVSQNGIYARKTADRTILVSGTPTDNVELTIPDAVANTYSVTLTGGGNATVSGDTSQTDLSGPMASVTYTAEAGYHFESFADITNNGITATRTSDTVVTVTGTPIGNASITIPDAVLITYSVTLTGGDNATRGGGNATQSGLTGAMTEVTYTAEAGYHFESFADITNNGITATRTSDTVVTVTGTPTANASLTIPDAVLSHVHSFTYTAGTGANANKITAKCSEGCPDGYDDPGYTITLNAPTNLTSGAPREATISGYPTSNVPAELAEAPSTIDYYNATAPGSIETSGVALGSAPSAAGDYVATVTWGGATAKVAFSIGKEDINPTVSMNGWTYGGSANTPSVEGNLGSGAVTYEYFTNAGCTDKTTEANGASGEGLVPSFAGTYYVKASIAATSTHNAGEATASFTISKKALTITASDQSITYGQSISEETTDVSVTGLVTGDSLFGIDIEQSTVNATDAGTLTPSSAVIKKGETDVSACYDITYNTGTLTIAKVSITIKAKNQTVELNGSISTDVSKAEVSEGTLVTGDGLYSVTLESSSTASVTTSGTITASAAEIKDNNGTGNDVTSNYDITYEQGVLTVSQALPTVTAPTAKSNLKYTGNPIELINAGSTTGGTLLYSLDGSSYNEDVTTITGEDAGTYTVYYKVDGGENYGSTEPESFTVTIGKMNAPASVASANSPTAVADLEYTGSNQALVTAPSSLPTGYATIKYRLSDSAEWSETIPAGTAVSSYTVQVKYFGDSNHEDFVGENIAVSIGAKDLSAGVSVSQSATSFEVGSTPCVPTVTVTKTQGSTVLASGTDYDVEYIGVSPTTYAQSATAPTSAGTYKVVIVFRGNYTGSFTATESFAITRPTASISTHDLSTVYDGSTYDVSALFTFPDGVGTKTYSVVESASTGEGSVTGSTLTITKAGSIKISVTTVASESVDSLTASATLVVNKGTATGTISVSDVTYGTALSNPTVTVNPVGAGSGTVEYKKDGTTTWSATKPTAAGNYTARVTVGGNDLYEAATETDTFTINKATLAVSPTSGLTKVYGQTDPAITYEVSGLKYEDTREQVLSGAPSRLPGEDAGSYLIIVGSLQVVGTNYTLNYTPGTFTVTKATHDNVTVLEANAVTVPTDATGGLTFDASRFITPAPGAGTTYEVSSRTGIVATSPTLSGCIVNFSVDSSTAGDTGTVVVTVTETNYNPYTLTVTVKSAAGINYRTETEISGSGQSPVSSVNSLGLQEYAQSLSSASTASKVKMEVEKLSTSTYADAIVSAAGRLFIGYTDADLTKSYLDITIKKATADSVANLPSDPTQEVPDIGTPIEIALSVGSNVTDKNPVIVREHGGSVSLLTKLGSRPSKPYTDGTFYVDDAQEVIYVYSRYFSQYSLVYSSVAPLTVTFDTAGGSYVPSVSVKSGSALTRPSNPSKSGYSFGGWLFAGAAYDFSTPVSSDITLVARWNAASSSSGSSDSDHSHHSDSDSGKKEETKNPQPQPTQPAPKAKITKVPEKLVTAKIDKKNTKKQTTQNKKKETVKDTKKDDTKKETVIPTVGASTDSDKIDEAYDRSVSTDKAVTAIAMAVCIAAIAFVAWLLFMLKHSKESVA